LLTKVEPGCWQKDGGRKMTPKDSCPDPFAKAARGSMRQLGFRSTSNQFVNRRFEVSL
jgi:hypothetical protein